MNLVFLGPPGAGKGTQAARYASAQRIPHISTGQILREAVAAGTALGREAKGYLDSGTLVPDEVITAVVSERLGGRDCKGGFLLDGFPRTVPQAELLERRLGEMECPLDAVVLFDVPADELERRMLGRGRDDDTPETVRRRLAVYAHQTEPLMGWYRGRGLLREVDGTGTPDQVFDRLSYVVGNSRP